MENNSQDGNLKGSGSIHHAQSLETQQTLQVSGQDPRIKENLLENRYKVMKEIAIKSQESGSDGKIQNSQTGKAPAIHQWQVGPHGELIGPSASGDSMKTSEIESSAKSSSSEIPQPMMPLKRAGTIAVAKLDRLMIDNESPVKSPKRSPSGQFLGPPQARVIPLPEVESAYHGKQQKEMIPSLEAGKASMRGSELGSQYSQMIDKRGSNAYNDSIDSQEKFKKAWHKSSLGSGLSERLSYGQNENMSSQKNYPQKIIQFEQQDSEQNGYSQGPANLIQGNHQASNESNAEYQNTKQMVEFFEQCNNEIIGSQHTQSEQLLPSDSIGGTAQLQPRMDLLPGSEAQYNQMTFQNLNESIRQQDPVPSGDSLMGSIVSSQQRPTYQASIRSSQPQTNKISDSMVYQNSSIEFIEQSNQNIFKQTEERQLIEDLNQLREFQSQNQADIDLEYQREFLQNQEMVQQQMYEQQQYLQKQFQEQQQLQQQQHLQQQQQQEHRGLDQNYRNYSVLSKVVRNTSQHSRAIEQSLRTMQEAQRTIQQTLNTSETARTGGIFSNRAMVYNPASIASPTSGQVYSQDMELGIVSGERQIIQVPSFTNLQAMTVDTNPDPMGTIEYQGFSHLRQEPPSRQLSPYQVQNESSITMTGKIPNRIHETRSRSGEPLRASSQSPSAHRRSQSSHDLEYSRTRSAYKRQELQNSGLALLKKTSALIKNPPIVSSYKSNSNLKSSIDESLLESSAKRRPKSSQNRRYCIGKLFKKATGVDLQQYKKAQEYRISNRSNSVDAKASQQVSPMQDQTHSLRIKSRSRSKKSSIREQAESYRQNLNRIEMQPQQLPQSPEVAQKLTRATKINRYKKIEKELEVDREIEQERQWIQEREAWEQEQARLEILKMEQQKQALEEQERLIRWNAERERQAAIEEQRKQEFVHETMRMMQKFEQEHPSLVEQDMAEQRLRQQYSEAVLNFPRQMSSKSKFQLSSEKPPVPIKVYEKSHTDEPRIQSNNRRQQEDQFHSQYMNIKQYNTQVANSKVGSNHETLREHQNSNFTLGGDPQATSHFSLQQSSRDMHANYREREQQYDNRQLSPTPDFQMYDNRSSRPVIHLQNVAEEPMTAPAPPAYLYNIGQGLQQPNESLLGMFRDEEMPSMIHREQGSRISLRSNSPPQDYISRNQAIRYQFEGEHGERSRSRPDAFPCKGPSSRSYQREHSPSITGMELRSNFGQRQREQELQTVQPDSLNDRQSLRMKSQEYQVYNVQVPEAQNCWNIEGIEYAKKSKSIDLKQRVTEVQNEVQMAAQSINQISKKAARNFMNEEDEQIVDLGKNYRTQVAQVDNTQSQTTVAHSQQSLPQAVKKKKQKKNQRETDFKRLMDLQVKQAQMLMDLQKQYFESQDLESSRQISESTNPRGSKQSLKFKNGMISHRSHQSENKKSTMDLIQTIYKQMEKINIQIAKKQQIEEDRFTHLDKKMRKLQKKYEKVKKINQEVAQSSPRSKHEADTEGRSQTNISENIAVNQSQDVSQDQQFQSIKNINKSSSVSSYQPSSSNTAVVTASLSQINMQLKQFENPHNPYVQDSSSHFETSQPQKQGLPDTKQSFGAQYPSMQSMEKKEQSSQSSEQKVQNQTSLKNIDYKLHTIQSNANENDQSSRFNNVLSEQIHSIEQLMQGENTSVFSDRQKNDLEKQVQVMNQQVIQLREEQKVQIDQLKQHYEQQMKNSSEELANKVIQKILQNNSQVSQKEKLEKRLHRIKEKLKAAKNIKENNKIFEIQKQDSNITPVFRSEIQTLDQAPQVRVLDQEVQISRAFVKEESHAPQPQVQAQLKHFHAVPELRQGINEENNYSQYTSQTQLDSKRPGTDFVAFKNQSMNLGSDLTQKTQDAEQQPIRDQRPLDQVYNSMNQSAITMHGQASVNILESDQNIYKSGDRLHNLTSQEDFSKQLNYQYLSRDLKKSTSSQKTLILNQSDAQDKFLQPFRPNNALEQSIGGPINDIYLRDTTQSLMQMDLNSDSRQKIMLDEKKGINQKILDLQSLQSKKLNDASGYSIEESGRSSNQRFLQMYNPSQNESYRTHIIGNEKIQDHINNIKNIQKTMNHAPIPIRQSYYTNRTETVRQGDQYQMPTESSWSNTDRVTENMVTNQQQHIKLQAATVQPSTTSISHSKLQPFSITNSNPISTRQVGLSSKFVASKPSSRPFEMQAEQMQVISHSPSEQSNTNFQFTGYQSNICDTREKYETKDHRDYTFKKQINEPSRTNSSQNNF